MNMAGMNGGYGESHNPREVWPQETGPVAGQHYPVYSTELMDYYVSKGFTHIRLPFSWDRIQSRLWGPVPAEGQGYQTYFGHLQRTVNHLTGRGATVLIEPWQAGPPSTDPEEDGVAGGARWRGQLVGSPQVDRYAFADFWAKMATIFRDIPLVEYGLVNEPNGMSTMDWWVTAQKCIDYIRRAGASTRIYVEGNGWSGAGSWKQDWYDHVPAGQPQRSNAYGWLNANGPGQPLWDPLHKTAAQVHLYFDNEGSGKTNEIVDENRRHQRLSPAIEEGAAQGYQVLIGEFAVWAEEPEADAAVAQVATYVAEHQSTCLGALWWASGEPTWWHNQEAPNYALRRHNKDTDTIEDTANMALLLKYF
ncbi:glycoside hydrolase family 5 protein [Kocuria sabuli]|uniref:glycoside hydrolase family 5 protein n=1 Tax=Kocuria sabuli TaxID=3071448 RepID=UPI0034D5234B